MFQVPDIASRSLHTVGVLRCSSFRDGDHHVIALAGELDLATLHQLERALEQVQRADAELVVVDLSELSFMDSSGLQFLIAADSRLDGLVIVKGSHAVQRVVEICGFSERLPFVDERPGVRGEPDRPPALAAVADLTPDDRATGPVRAAAARRSEQAAMSNAVRRLRSRPRRSLRSVP